MNLHLRGHGQRSIQRTGRPAPIRRGLQRRSMQKQPIQSDLLAQPLVPFGIGILVATGDRETQVLGTLTDYAQMMDVVYHRPAQ